MSGAKRGRCSPESCLIRILGPGPPSAAKELVSSGIDVSAKAVGQGLDVALRRIRPLLPPGVVLRRADVAHENMLVEVRYTEASNKGVHRGDV